MKKFNLMKIVLLSIVLIISVSMTSCVEKKIKKEESKKETTIKNLEEKSVKEEKKYLTHAELMDEIEDEMDKIFADELNLTYTKEELINYTKEELAKINPPKTKSEINTNPIIESKILGIENYAKATILNFISSKVFDKMAKELKEYIAEGTDWRINNMIENSIKEGLDSNEIKKDIDEYINWQVNNDLYKGHRDTSRMAKEIVYKRYVDYDIDAFTDPDYDKKKIEKEESKKEKTIKNPKEKPMKKEKKKYPTYIELKDEITAENNRRLVVEYNLTYTKEELINYTKENLAKIDTSKTITTLEYDQMVEAKILGIENYAKANEFDFIKNKIFDKMNKEVREKITQKEMDKKIKPKKEKLIKTGLDSKTAIKKAIDEFVYDEIDNEINKKYEELANISTETVYKRYAKDYINTLPD